MKTMTCKALGGACDLEFKANTFEELALLSQQHAMEMLRTADQDHLQAMEMIKGLMSDPVAMQNWKDARRAQFDALPDQA